MRYARKIKQVMANALVAAMMVGNLTGPSLMTSYGAVNTRTIAIKENPKEAAAAEGLAIPSSVRLTDSKAAPCASRLYAYLKAVGESQYVLYGHQNDTHHKGGGNFEGSSSSDTKDLTGSIAAVCGIDSLSFTGAEMQLSEGKKDTVDEAAAVCIDAASEGAIITLSAHMPNFALVAEKGKDRDGNYDYSGYTPGVTTGNVMERILPGGDLNEVYTGFLDMIARYGDILQQQEIPVLFRPFHENNGSWFWWGAAYCDEEGYKNVYRYTVEYLRDVKGIHNFLYVYSPNGPFENIADYESCYPGDAYVDVMGFDMYHDSPRAQDGWMDTLRETVGLVEEAAARHGKIPAVAETGMRVNSSLGDGSSYSGIAPAGNTRPEWFNEVAAVVSESSMPYFMVWANFDQVENVFAPYKVSPSQGHEMSDAFIRFYNNPVTLFANGTNFYGRTDTPSVQGNGMSGYFLSPASGSRMEKPERIRISLSSRAESVKVILSDENGAVSIPLDAKPVASSGGMEHIYQARVTRENLDALGETTGPARLLADGEDLGTIHLLFNIPEIETEPMIVDRFENYMGKTALLERAWATNMGLGCDISPELSSEYKSEGEYGLAFRYRLFTAGGEGWAGMTKLLDENWSGMNGLQLWIAPDGRGQKLVIQLTSQGEDFEVYLPELAATTNAGYVTIPFQAMKGKNGGTLDPSSISGFGIWCNTIGQGTTDSVMYFDDIHVVNTGASGVVIGDERLETGTPDRMDQAGQEGEDSREETGKAPLDPEIMRLGPGYVNPEKEKAQDPVQEQPIIVTELFKEGSGDKYESKDVAWLTNSAPTDYVTLEYTCDDPEKAGWGIMGWGATVDGQ